MTTQRKSFRILKFFQSTAQSVLVKEEPPHLPMHSAEQFKVAVSLCRVCAVGGLVEIFQGHRCLPHVVVCASQQIVCTHLFVGRTLSFVVVGDLFHDAVGGERHEALVLGVCAKQVVAHEHDQEYV